MVVSADLKSNFGLIMLCELYIQVNSLLEIAFSFLICCLLFPLAASQAAS